MEEENSNYDVFDTLFNFVSFKFKLILIIVGAILCLILFIVLMIGAVKTTVNKKDDYYDENGSLRQSDSSSQDSSSSQAGEIVSQDGLSWIGSDHTFCSPVQKLTGIGSGFGKKGSAWSLGYHTGTDMFGNPRNKYSCCISTVKLFKL